MIWVIAVIGAWIPLYMLISLRVVYKQNWFMTMGKFVMIGISYMTMLGLVTTGVATVAVLFPVAAGMYSTGSITLIADKLIGLPETLNMANLRTLPPIATASALISS